MLNRLLLVGLLLLNSACVGTVSSQVRANPSVSFSQGFATPMRVDATTLSGLPRQKISVAGPEATTSWEGVALIDLLRKAGAPLGDALRGEHLSKYLLVIGADGYQVVFALADFDPAYGAKNAILADTRNGKPLDVKDGPYRLVLEHEKRAGRSVRQVVRVELLSATGARR